MPLLASWLAVSTKRIGDEEDDKLISILLGRCLIPVHHVPFFGRLFETLFFGATIFKTDQRVELESADNRFLSRTQNHIQRSPPDTQSKEPIQRYSTPSIKQLSSPRLEEDQTAVERGTISREKGPTRPGARHPNSESGAVHAPPTRLRGALNSTSAPTPRPSTIRPPSTTTSSPPTALHPTHRESLHHQHTNSTVYLRSAV